MRSSVDMLRRVVVCGAAAAAFPAWAQPVSGNEASGILLGRWRSLATSKGGIGSMLEFGADGVVAYSPGAVVDAPYRIEADQLVLPPATTTGPEVREIITWLGADRIRFRSQADLDPGQEFIRSGSSQSSVDSILGEWVGSREMAGRQVKVVRLFRSGGRLLLLIPFLTERGRYSVDERVVTLALPGKPTVAFTFNVVDEVLTLTTTDAKESKYERY